MLWNALAWSLECEENRNGIKRTHIFLHNGAHLWQVVLLIQCLPREVQVRTALQMLVHRPTGSLQSLVELVVKLRIVAHGTVLCRI